jgi:hypothetical protein
MTRITIDEIQKTSDKILMEAHKIRVEKGAKYGDGFQDFYNKYGMLGMETDLYRKFARIGQFTKTNNPVEDQRALENNFLDIINYCLLQMTHLRHNHWNEFSWEKEVSRKNFLKELEKKESPSLEDPIPQGYKSLEDYHADDLVKIYCNMDYIKIFELPDNFDYDKFCQELKKIFRGIGR